MYTVEPEIELTGDVAVQPQIAAGKKEVQIVRR